MFSRLGENRGYAVRKRFALAVLAALALVIAAAVSPASAEQAPDSEPKIALPHNCVNYYPEAAVRANAEGTAIVAFTIGADGFVKEPKIEKSSGNADLDAASLQCVTGWQYIPARRGGAATYPRSRSSGTPMRASRPC